MTIRTLIVDDEPSVRESLQLILSRHYDVSVSESGNEALEALRDLAELGRAAPAGPGTGTGTALAEQQPRQGDQCRDRERRGQEGLGLQPATLGGVTRIEGEAASPAAEVRMAAASALLALL